MEKPKLHDLNSNLKISHNFPTTENQAPNYFQSYELKSNTPNKSSLNNLLVDKIISDSITKWNKNREIVQTVTKKHKLKVKSKERENSFGSEAGQRQREGSCKNSGKSSPVACCSLAEERIKEGRTYKSKKFSPACTPPLIKQNPDSMNWKNTTEDFLSLWARHKSQTLTNLRQNSEAKELSKKQKAFSSLDLTLSAPHRSDLQGLARREKGSILNLRHAIGDNKEDVLSLMTKQMMLLERELELTRKNLEEAIEKLHKKELEVMQLKEKDLRNELNTLCGIKSNHDMTESHQPNFEELFKKLQELNYLASQPKMVQTAHGARFEVPTHIPITFYSNGILLMNGPFRNYQHLSTQCFLKDILDGFFPSELQDQYPDGVPFDIRDRHQHPFKKSSLVGFMGKGQPLGCSRTSTPDKCSSCSVTNSQTPLHFMSHKSDTKKLMTLDPTVGEGVSFDTQHVPVSREEFLKRLPICKISGDGKIIPIRKEVSESLKDETNTMKLIRVADSNGQKPILMKIKSLRHNTNVCMVEICKNQLIKEVKTVIDDILDNKHSSNSTYRLTIPGSKSLLVTPNENKQLLECGITQNCIMYLSFA